MLFAMAAVLILLPSCCCAAVQNICDLIKIHPNWYEAAKVTQLKWGVPVPVQLAIIQQESDFDADAKSPTSTAFGYAQIVNKDWYTYTRRVTDDVQGRNVFADATNFIGWYANLMKSQIHISPDDAFALYMAYHDGSSGYLEDLRRRYAPVRTLAYHVQSVADKYQKELVSC